MIKNGKDIPLNLAGSGLPNVSAALSGFFQPMKFKRVQKTAVAGRVQEVEFVVQTRGVRQPFSAQALSIRPEGERSWKWETLHCLPEAILQTDDVVDFDGDRFRVVEKFDWKEYGYVQYNIAQDFKDC